nr:MAG: ORF1 [TTV-like mini virus]
MAPYFRRRNWFRRPRYRWRRNTRRPWRLRRTFQRNRRRTKVKRRRYRKYKFRKLKKLSLKQWQPNHIKLCKIKGFIQLFGAGIGQISNSFTAFKESTVPPHEPGGGGWGLQQITLGTLYTQNDLLMNWWTVSNKGLNLCRFLKAKFKLFRQPDVDYIFAYDIEPPYNVTKYYYTSTHPMRMLNYNKKVIVPSFKTQPHNRKPYIKLSIPPPKELINRWYFQNHFANSVLVQFLAVSCDLTNMFQGPKSINNNVTLNCLNTAFFTNPCFQYPKTTQYGYQPDSTTYIYGISNAYDPNWEETPVNHSIYLGDTMNNDPGEVTDNPIQPQTWGNPFFFNYLDFTEPSYISKKSPEELKNLIAQTNKKVKDMQPIKKYEPYIKKVRYNPNADKGHGNEAYWIPNFASTQRTWEPTTDTDLHIEGFPLWILLWGWQDFTQKLGKITNINQDYILVVKTPYILDKLPYYVFLSEDFTLGLGPYETERKDIILNDYKHWYPRFRFQKQAIESILQTGPAVYKGRNNLSIEAHMFYNFYFKWGGNPSPMANIYDPNSQPIYPTPNPQQLRNEIISPETTITDYLYQWDSRRDFLTQTAIQRIKEIPPNETTLFTDGTFHSTEVPFKTTQETQAKDHQKETEETLLNQLLLIQQHNNNLQQRLQQLKLTVQNLL